MTVWREPVARRPHFQARPRFFIFGHYVKVDLDTLGLVVMPVPPMGYRANKMRNTTIKANNAMASVKAKPRIAYPNNGLVKDGLRATAEIREPNTKPIPTPAPAKAIVAHPAPNTLAASTELRIDDCEQTQNMTLMNSNMVCPVNSSLNGRVPHLIRSVTHRWHRHNNQAKSVQIHLDVVTKDEESRPLDVDSECVLEVQLPSRVRLFSGQCGT
eukprot:TRINITY_DN10_c0_g1_i13.p1 TRINITY_DN10_c0_g1~~TRINITY_DN10_c0_g1_i13.p1  ORF type:complete len:214 (+),score=2.80 TRINITY_DN10_c0_g1_i13:210-851(+)